MGKFVLGAYVPRNTILHRLDARIKFICLILLVVAIFIQNPWESYIYIGVFLAGLFVLSRASYRIIFSIIKSLLIMGVFLFIINMFTVKHGLVLTPHNWSFKIYSKSITITLYIIIRIILMMFLTFLLTMTTKPLDLTLAIEDLLKPLKIFRFPSNVIAIIISISLRFIPTLIDETTRIMKAQASRGVDFKNGNINEKMKSLISLIIPLFVSSFQRANDLSNAMEARGYDPYAKRTRYHTFKIRFVDILALLVVLGMLTWIILNSQGHFLWIYKFIPHFQENWGPN